MSAASRVHARFVALVVSLALALPACSAVPDTFACQHCACDASARALSRPMLCSTVGRDTACCMPIFLGS